MKQHHTIVGKQLRYLREERIVVAQAHMLEHSDRHDPVKGALDHAIVQTLEI